MIAPNGADAWLYFPITRAFAQWHDGKLTPLAVRVDGQVLALGQGFTIAVRRPNGVWILSRDSAILDSLPPETANVLLLPGATIFSTSDSLVLRRPGSNDLTFPAPGISALYQMGGALVEARAGSILYALDITPGSERLFQLPQPSRDTRR